MNQENKLLYKQIQPFSLPNKCNIYKLYFFFFSVLQFEPWASHMLSKIPTTELHPHPLLFYLETVSHYVTQAGLKLCDLPPSDSQVGEITGMCLHIGLSMFFYLWENDILLKQQVKYYTIRLCCFFFCSWYCNYFPGDYVYPGFVLIHFLLLYQNRGD